MVQTLKFNELEASVVPNGVTARSWHGALLALCKVAEWGLPTLMTLSWLPICLFRRG